MGSAADYAKALLPTCILGNFNNIRLHTYEALDIMKSCKALKLSVVLQSQTWGN